MRESANHEKDPQFLYRYRSMTSRNLDRTFTHNELYFSCPDQFNDPFDCKTRFTFKNCNIHDVRRYFEHASKVHQYGLSDTEIKEMIEKLVDEFNSGSAEFPKKMENVMDEILPETIKTLKVLCLSEVYDDILMWSHYTNGHRGIVLQFDTTALKEQFTGCKKVVYYPGFPTLSDFNERHEELFILSKSKHWEYEKEWRIIEPVEDKEKDEIGKVYTFEKNALTGIILGCEIFDNERDRIRMWRDYGQPQAGIYKSVKDNDSYAIKVDFTNSE